MDDFSKLKNIGKVGNQWLHDAGIHTLDELELLGAVEAWKRIKALYPDKVTLNGLYALQAGLMNIHWTALPEDIKTDLRKQAVNL